MRVIQGASDICVNESPCKGFIIQAHRSSPEHAENCPGHIAQQYHSMNSTARRYSRLDAGEPKLSSTADLV